MGLRVDNPIVGGKMTFEQGMKIYGADIESAANEYNIPKDLLSKLIYIESEFDINAKSKKGAQGLGQFMPNTAKEYEVDVKDPKSSIYGAAKYLNTLNKQVNGDWNKTLAAYNWGIGNLQKKGIENAPKETRKYITKILGEQKNTPSLNLPNPQISLPQSNINYEMINEFQKIMNETKQVIEKEKENTQVEDAKSKLMERQNAINFIKELKLNYSTFKPQ